MKTLFAAALEKPDPAARAAYLDSACTATPTRGSGSRRCSRPTIGPAAFLARPAVAPADPTTAPTRGFRRRSRRGPHPHAWRRPRIPTTTKPSASWRRRAGPTRSAGSGTTRCSRSSARAASASSSGRSTTCCSGSSRSRCWPRSWPPRRRPASGSSARPGRRPQVRHENVVQVYAVEEQPLPYLVMEFIPGETLQQRLDRTGPLGRARGRCGSAGRSPRGWPPPTTRD